MDYFMDKLEDWEMYELMDVTAYADTNNWEQTRLISYIIAQVNSKKKLKLKDIMKFPWEKEMDAKDIEISTSDVNNLREKAQRFLKYIDTTDGRSTT